MKSTLSVLSTKELRRAAEKLPRISLGHFPTPLEPLPRFTEALGGPPLPSIGIAPGIDRILMARTQGGKRPSVDVYVVALTPEAQRIALKMATGLRRDGIAADLDLMGRAMKGQLKDASRSGARFAAIIGQDEVASETVTLKDLSSGEQESIPRNELPERIYR